MVLRVREQQVLGEPFEPGLGRCARDRIDGLPGPTGPEGSKVRRPGARDAVATGFARASRRLSRLSRRGEGSSLPGVVAEALSPGFVARRAAALPDGVIVVSGTNGKTTTASMIGAILSHAGVPTLGNDTGANLRQGIAAAFVGARAGARRAVLEVDEGVLGTMVPALRPRLFVLTNVFRDQLDRFGETERVVELIRRSCDRLPEGATIVANSDDPLLRFALDDRPHVTFGVRLDPDGSVREGAASAEPEICPRCGETLVYERRAIAHVGRARCAGCSWGWTPPDVEVRVLHRRGLCSVELEVEGTAFTLPTGGVYNAYNAAAAIAATKLTGIEPRTAIAALRGFRPRFGRTEQLVVDGRKVWLTLMKNPGSADAVIQEIAGDPELGAVVVAVNDAAADGRDVSWIWDVDLERLATTGVRFFPTGVRGSDVGVRLKYAGAQVERVRREPLDAIRAAIGLTDPGRSPVVLATYTAMLEVRAALSGRVARLMDRPA